jgi:hypothetical protein
VEVRRKKKKEPVWRTNRMMSPFTDAQRISWLDNYGRLQFLYLPKGPRDQENGQPRIKHPRRCYLRLGQQQGRSVAAV